MPQVPQASGAWLLIFELCSDRVYCIRSGLMNSFWRAGVSIPRSCGSRRITGFTCPARFVLNLRRAAVVMSGDSGNSIFSSVIQTLKSWIAGDRVRVLASSGRSLSLQPGNRIFMDGRNYVVQTRTQIEDADSQDVRLVYVLIDQESDRTRTLEVVVRKDGTGMPQAVLKGGRDAASVCDADITIL